MLLLRHAELIKRRIGKSSNLAVLIATPVKELALAYGLALRLGLQLTATGMQAAQSFWHTTHGLACICMCLPLCCLMCYRRDDPLSKLGNAMTAQAAPLSSPDAAKRPRLTHGPGSMAAAGAGPSQGHAGGGLLCPATASHATAAQGAASHATTGHATVGDNFATAGHATARPGIFGPMGHELENLGGMTAGNAHADAAILDDIDAVQMHGMELMRLRMRVHELQGQMVLEVKELQICR